jgi:hypothetical protein
MQSGISAGVRCGTLTALVNHHEHYLVIGMWGTPPHATEEGMVMFKRFVAVAIAGMFAAGMANAQTSAGMSTSGATPSASSCEAKAIGKDGKPLSGAAKTSFMKKCEGGMKKSAVADCEGKAVGSNGKPLAGAAKTSFMKKCEAKAAM